MRKLLFILLLLPGFAIGQTYDKVVESTDSTIVGGVFQYRDSVIDMNAVSFHEFSEDSVFWHKAQTASDIWVRFSNDNQNTWVTLPISIPQDFYTKTESDTRYLQDYTETQSYEDVLTINNRSAVSARFEAEAGSGTSPKGLSWYLNFIPGADRAWINSELTTEGRSDYYMQDLVFGTSHNLGLLYPLGYSDDAYETFRLIATGQLKARLYGSGNFENNSPAYISGYDAVGRFVEINPDSIGGDSFWTADANGIVYNGTIGLGGNAASATYDMTSDNILVNNILYANYLQDPSGTSSSIRFNSPFIVSSNSPASSSNGTVYYSNSLGKFRAYENGEWKDLISDPTAGTGTDLSFSDITSSSFTLNSNTGADVVFNLANITASGNGTSITLTGGTGGSMVYPGAGIPVSTGSAWGTSITNNSGNWNDAYNNKIVSGAVTGTVTKTITLTQQDGGTVNFSFTDLQSTSGGGDVYKDGTPVNKQLGVWIGDGIIKGVPDLEWEDTYLSIGNGLIRMYATNGNIISEAVSTDAIYLSEKSVKPTAAPGTGVFYPKTDGKPYFVNDAGVEYDLSATGSSGISDGDKGDISVTNLGETWNIDPGVVGASELASTTVNAGTYTNPTITVDADGRATYVQSNIGQIGFSGAKVYCNSTQTATSSGTILSFGGEEYDISGMHSTTNSSRITMPTVYGSASIIEVTFTAQFKAFSDITGEVELLKNGSVLRTWDLEQTGTTGQLTIGRTEKFVVAADDYLEIRVTTSSNSTSATTTALRPAFSVDLITIVT